jgi:Flp pilus assembly protein TadG
MPRVDLRDERGAYSVFIALLIPGLIVFIYVVVNTGNFWVHQRHLQVQADAAALAGGGAFQITNCNQTAIETEARRFSGELVYNRQVGDRPTALDPLPNNPCQLNAQGKYLIDATVRETSTSPLISFAGALGLPLAKSAAVEINQIEELKGTLPLVLRDVRVDRVGLPGFGSSVKPNGSGVASLSVSFDGSKPTVDIPVSLYFKDDAALTCASDNVDCYATDAGTSPVIHLQGFLPQTTAVTTNSPPALRKVTVQKGAGCANRDTGYFATPGCTLTVFADIDWVNEVDNATPSPDKEADVAVNGSAMAYDITTSMWKASLTAPTGMEDLTITWEQQAGRVKPTGQAQDCANTNQRRCTGVFRGGQLLGTTTMIGNTTESALTTTPVHAVFGHTVDNIGLIEFADVSDSAVTSGANTYIQCTTTCTKTLTVSIGTPPPPGLGDEIELTPSGDPLGSSSNRGYLACEPDNGGGTSQFRTTLAVGCNKTFGIHGSGPCPGYSDIESQVEPWTCVATKPGNPESSLESGISARIAAPNPATAASNFNPSTGECAANPNRYPTYPSTDRRIVAVYLATNPTGEAGRKTFPIRDFAHIYVTGWAGNKDGGPCVGIGGTLAAKAGTVRGYLIKYVGPNDGSAYGTQTCLAADLGGCVPVLTR